MQSDSQTTADWQTQDISALTNMFEEVCFSSRLAFADTNTSVNYFGVHVFTGLSTCCLTKEWKTQTSTQSKILWLSACSWISLSRCLVNSDEVISVCLLFSDSSPRVNSTFCTDTFHECPITRITNGNHNVFVFFAGFTFSVTNLLTSTSSGR